MKRHIWACVCVASLAGAQAGAVEFFVPVPHLGGRFVYSTEFVRQDLGRTNVDFTYVEEGASGVGRTPVRYKVLPGPSTDKYHPLLTDNYDRDFDPKHSDPKYYLTGGGLVILEGEQGLLGVESAVLIGGEPTTAWELPMLTEEDAFEADGTVHVLNLLQDGTTSSQLSLFNMERTAASCRTRLLAANGQLLQERTNLAVPALGALRIQDIVSKVVVGTATNLSVAVTCDRSFYTIGSFPSTRQTDIRVHYPSPEAPTDGTREIFVNNGSFRVTRDQSEKRFVLPLAADTRYRSIVIDFDVAVTRPTNNAYFRSLLGMWRPEPTLRFKKKLFFGTVERFDRSKLMADLGTPFIEVLIKRSKAALVAGRTYHFHIEINADERLFRQLVTTQSGTVVTDMVAGLFNDDLQAKNGNSLIVGFGLPGIADGAYSPPYGWRFSNIVISGYK